MSDALASLPLATFTEQLGHFLNSYCASMRSFAWCRSFHYVDAFGASRRLGPRSASPFFADEDSFTALAFYYQTHEDHLSFLRDSPRIAFEQSDFHSYTYIDPCAERELLVSDLAKEFPRHKVRTISDSCSKFLRSFAKRIPSSSQRALLFLDPFSMQTSWETIHSLAQPRSIDIVMKLPIGIALQRIFPSRFTMLDSNQRASFDRFFGAKAWREVLYEFSIPSGDKLDEQRITNAGSCLVNWYRDRLALIFAEVSAPCLVRSTSGGQLCYLLVASHRASTVCMAQQLLSAKALEH